MLKILHIESEGNDIELVKRLLVKAKLDVDMESAKTLKEALQVMERMPLDVIIMNVNLTDATGFESFYRVQRRSPLAKIIILSEGLDDETAEKYLEDGAKEYIDKSEVTIKNSQLVRSLWLMEKTKSKEKGK